MSYTIHPMSLGEVTADTSYLVFSWTPGTKLRAPYLAYLILGDGKPIVVDTGIRVDGRRRSFHRTAGWDPSIHWWTSSRSTACSRPMSVWSC